MKNGKQDLQTKMKRLNEPFPVDDQTFGEQPKHARIDEEKEDLEEESPIITLSPPPSINRNGRSFNKEDTFSDLDFIIAGLEKPLKLHRNILSQTSKAVEEILKKKHGSESADCNVIMWMCDTSKEVDREALVKVLRFCYGDTITVGVKNGECCAVIAALIRLQVICAADTVAKLSSFAIEQTKTNLRVGVELLMATLRYPECSNTDICALDKQLAEIVLSKERMQKHYDTIVDRCLMRLPHTFLDIAHFGEPHTKLSEFTVRARYVRYHSESLSQKEKEDIMKCDLNTFMSAELNQLNQLEIVEGEKLTALYHTVLERTEKDVNDLHIRVMNTQRESEKTRQKDRRTIARLESIIQGLRMTVRLL